ncbi:hypothetical protein CEXT_93281 [Caerostris extrusa]|uniref:Uncharacterized protein n=1 Tax=Caerostris extrusa TaxID=172846 RepID=A0AAV4NXP9_CAEEX|nr:hypothetical protein CEXT_93281 [Caerostris extrusa]
MNNRSIPLLFIPFLIRDLPSFPEEFPEGAHHSGLHQEQSGASDQDLARFPWRAITKSIIVLKSVEATRQSCLHLAYKR